MNQQKKSIIIIINRLPINKLNLIPILRKCKKEIILFCDTKNAMPYTFQFNTKVFDNIGENHLVELVIHEISSQYNISKIISLEEHDIIRTAYLRELLHIPGQTLKSAKLFRDKFLLKEKVKGKIPIAEYALVNTPIDIVDFTQKFQFPVILKPRDEMGSIGIQLINDSVSLNNWIEKNFTSNILVEKYISGTMYHVDGIIINNCIKFISVSEYIGTCLKSKTDSDALGSILLNENNIKAKKLANLTRNLLKLLDKPLNMTFHIEYFEYNNQFILCEAASRTGGVYISKLIQLKYGINLDEWFVSSELGIPYTPSTKKETYFAAMTIPPKPKRLLSYPKSVPYSFCKYYERRGKEGTLYSNYHTCAGRYAAFIVEGESPSSVQEKIMEVQKYVETNTLWK